MKQQTYINLMTNIKSNKKVNKLICTLNQLITKMVYVSFVVFILWLLISRNDGFFRILLTTGISFILISFFRKICNRERPYEKFNHPPIISKNKKGNSMPSRHVFSAFVIAMAFMYVNCILGIFFILLSIALAILRVLGGVHFPSDVIVGAIVGLICGLIGLWII